MTTLTPAPTPHEIAPEPPTNGRRTRTVAVVIAAVLVVLGGVVAWWFFTQPAGVDRAAVDSVTIELIAELESAAATADVRALAATASYEADQLRTALAVDGTGRDTVAAANASLRVWDEVAALQTLTADSLEQWSAVRPGLALALADLADYGPTDVTAGSDAALASVDDLVANAQAKMAAWTAQRDAAAATQQQNVALAAGVDSYRGTVSAQLTLYESLRRQTTAQVKVLYNQSADAEIWPVTNQLRAGETDRQGILAVLGAAPVPSGLEADHNRILTMIQDSIVAMRAGQSAIDEALTARYEDYNGEGPVPPFVITAAPSWKVFATTSARIDQELPEVWAAMSDQADSLIAKYQEPVGAPVKPTV